MTSAGTQDASRIHPAKPHPLGRKTRILLASVFGPYAQDDEYGSRTINPMELYHNQVTRVQGPFSLRMFHRSWGLMLLQANVSAPCVLLDFPTQDRFIEEIRSRRYDVVGISSIAMNVLKVKRRCELVRRHLPSAVIVVGGHIAGIPDLKDRVDADHIVRGEGVRWFRQFLGEDPDRPIHHPVIPTRIATRSMGFTLKEKPGDIAVTLIPSVGCPLGCNFCSTSAMFGGKGQSEVFYSTGDELFDIMCQLESAIGTRSFFVMDENFLLSRQRTLRLLDLMREHNKSWVLYIFSSARTVRSYSIEQLTALGISWIWMGLECESSQYVKLRGIDTRQLVRDLQSHGIHVMGSTIIGLEHHTQGNIAEAVEYAVRHDADFHQFMLYMPLPGTPLYRKMTEQGRMLDEGLCPAPDTHGQYRFNYLHANIPPGLETGLLLQAFQRDYEENGPSLLRILRTALAGWKRYKDCRDLRVHRRFHREIMDMIPTFAAVAWAAKRYYKDQPRIHSKMDDLLKRTVREFGIGSRLFAFLGGPYVLHRLRREEKRLAQGQTYEPPTFYDINDAAAPDDFPGSSRCAYVIPNVQAQTRVKHTAGPMAAQ